MSYRNTVLVENEIYHIFNRSVAKVPIFLKRKDYQRFLNLVDYYQYQSPPLRYSFFNRMQKEQKSQLMEITRRDHSPIVELLAFCLMPNHFHFLIKQLKPNGIRIFVSNIQNAYAKYINTKYERNGALFQAIFKAVRIATTEQLVHVSRYIHLNPVTAYILPITKLEHYQWSSFLRYMNLNNLSFVNNQLVLNEFKSVDDYKQFVFDQANYQRELDNIKHLTLEEE